MLKMAREVLMYWDVHLHLDLVGDKVGCGGPMNTVPARSSRTPAEILLF